MTVMPAIVKAELLDQVSVRDLRFFYGDVRSRSKNIDDAAAHQQGDGVHRSRRAAASRRCCACSTACTISIPTSARKARSCSTARIFSTPDVDVNLLALARRHGVPKADAFPDVDLRKHRLRHPPLRKALQVGARRARRGGAARRRAVGRGEGQAAHERAGAFGRAAATLVHRPQRRRAAGSDPVRRALFGARSDFDRQGRGADRRADGATTPSPSSPTTCSRRCASPTSPPSCISANSSSSARPTQCSRRRGRSGRKTTSLAGSAEILRYHIRRGKITVRRNANERPYRQIL